MPRTGTLRIWHEDRGFGFIAPGDGGPELFVHISAFPRDGSRPTSGERLSFEVGPGRNGKPQAVNVYRQALGRPSEYPASRRSIPQRHSRMTTAVAFLLVAGVVAYGHRTYRAQVSHVSAPIPQAADASANAPPMIETSYRCDGRTSCSQMTSCSEATFFLQNCPGTQMDGNNDGVPCERQWCTRAFRK